MKKWLLPIIGLLGFVYVSQALMAQVRQRPSSRRTLPEYFRSFKSHETEGAISRVVLRNGLTVLVEEHPGSPFVAITTELKVGFYDERSKNDEARVLSEVLGNRLEQAIYSIGGVAENQVSEYHSSFSSVIPSEELQDGLEHHAKLFQLDSVSDNELTLANAVVGSESTSSKELEGIFDAWELVYGAVPFLDSSPLSKEALKLFHEIYYHPQNMVLSVAGSLRREQVLRRVGELMAEEKPGDEAILASFGGQNFAPKDTEFEYRQERKPGPGPLVLIASGTPGPQHKDFLKVEMLKYLLSVGHGAILAIPQEDEEELPFAAEVSTYLGRQGTLFCISLAPDTDGLEKAEVRLLASFKAIATEGVPARVLNRAKALMVTEHFSSIEPIQKRAEALAYAELEGNFRRRDQFPAKVAQVSSEDISEVIDKYFSENKLAVIEFLPPDHEERSFSSESFLETLKILLPSEIQDRVGFLETFKTEDKAEGVSLAQFTASFSRRDLRRSSILRGPEIFLRERHDLPLVHLGFFYPGGRINETAETRGTTELLLQTLLSSWVRSEVGLTITSLEGLGAKITPVVESDFFGIIVTTLTPGASEVFMQMAEWLRSPGLEENDIETARLTLSRVEVVRMQALDSLLQKAREAVYGSHPYGVTFEPDAIEKISADSVRLWQSSLLERVHPYIIVSGDVEGTAFLEGMVEILSDSDFRVSKRVEKKVRYPADEEGAEAFHEVRSGGRLILAFPGPEEGSDSSGMLDVGNRMLTRNIGSLADRLKTQERLADSVEIWRESEVLGGAIFAEVRGAGDNLDESKSELIKAFKSFPEDSVSETQFLNGLVGTLTEFHLSLDDSKKFLVDTMKRVLSDEPADFSSKTVLNIKQYRIGEIETVYRRFFGGQE